MKKLVPEYEFSAEQLNTIAALSFKTGLTEQITRILYARGVDTAEKIAQYFISHIRPDGLTDSDFCQPAEEERIDNLAGVIAACGFIELAKAAGNARYREQGERLLDGVIDHCCDLTDHTCGVLTHCTASYHDDGAGRHTNIVYGDFFLAEALGKLNGTDPMLWI